MGPSANLAGPVVVLRFVLFDIFIGSFALWAYWNGGDLRLRLQPVRELIRPPLQLRVGEPLVSGHHRHRGSQEKRALHRLNSCFVKEQRRRSTPHDNA